MTPPIAQQEREPGFIRARLAAGNVRSAVIVDDTYDGLSSEMLGDALDKFSLVMSAQDDLFLEVQRLCPGIQDPDEFDLDRAKVLWAARERWSATLNPIAQELFAIHLQKQDRLVQLQQNLEAVGLSVQTLRPSDGVPNDVQLVFLDLCLDPSNERTLVLMRQEQMDRGAEVNGTVSIGKRAEEIAQNLAARGTTRPFLVLISDHAELDDVERAFQHRVKYLASTFTCLPKSEAADPNVLYFRLCCCGVGNPALRPLHDFVLAIMDSLSTSADAFRDALYALDIQDYSFIQRLSLASDGEPLGEYILDLFGAALSHELRDTEIVRAARPAVDSLIFASHLPSAGQPSPDLRRLYGQAITHPGVGALAPHPLQHLQNPAPTSSVPRVGLGDILSKQGSSAVLMVANPACDLQFSPTNPMRLPDPNLPIYLIPGKLQPLGQAIINQAAKRTELFELSGETFRIEWDPKYAFSIELRDLYSWCDSQQYRRIGRLETTHALSVQQAWTSGLSRVGVAVSPPLTDSADFVVYLMNQRGDLEAFGRQQSGQIILGKCRRADEFVNCVVVTQAGMFALRQAATEAGKRFRSFSADVPPGPNQAHQVTTWGRKATTAEAWAADWQYWFSLVEREHELRLESGNFCRAGHITLGWQCSPAGTSAKKKFGGDEVFMVVDISQVVSRMTPSPDDIRARAYELYVKRGCLSGHETDDWLEAERQMTPQTPGSVSL